MEEIHINKEVSALIDLGLSDKEALIYFAALNTGGGTVSELAQSGSIERTGIYYHINHLLQMKLLKPIMRGKRTIYLPADPDRLKRIAEHKQKLFMGVFPQMQERFSRQASKSIFEYFEGREEVSKFYDHVYNLLANLEAPDNVIYVLGNSYRTVTASDKELFNFTPPVKKNRYNNPSNITSIAKKQGSG